MPTLNKTFVEATDEPGLYSDEEITGFRLKVTDAGTKVYLVYGKVKGNPRPIKVTIGRHGDYFKDGGILTAAKARDEAELIRGKLRAGINPNDVQREKVKVAASEKAKEASANEHLSITVRKVFEDYVETGRIKDSTAYIYRCVVFKRLKDWLDKPLSDITRDMIEKRHKNVSREFPGDANHAMRVLRLLFYFSADTYSDDKGQPFMATDNIRRLFPKTLWNKLKPRRDVIKDHELAAWFQAVQSLDNSMVRDYLTVTILTGLRRAECASIRWENVDFKAKTLTVTDTKNKRDLTLPLPDYLLGVFKRRWNNSDRGTFVFPGETKSGFMTLKQDHHIDKVIAKVREILTSSDDEKTRLEAKKFRFMPHTLRRVFSTVAGRLCPDYIVKQLTNHMDKSDVTQTHYFVAGVEELREPMRMVNEYILNAAKVDQSQTQTPNNKVVSLQSKKSKSSK